MPSVARLFGARWTRGVISEMLTTDHYTHKCAPASVCMYVHT